MARGSYEELGPHADFIHGALANVLHIPFKVCREVLRETLKAREMENKDLVKRNRHLPPPSFSVSKFLSA